MYCSNCGKELKDDEKFCENCGKQIVRDEVVLEAERVEETNNNIEVNYDEDEMKKKHDDSQANLLCGISLFLMYGLGLVLYFIPGLNALSTISPMCAMAAIVLMIIARVKYPENTFAKVLMWLYIISVIIYIVLMVALIVACGIACANTDFSSCG